MVKIFYLDVSALPEKFFTFDGFCAKRTAYVKSITNKVRFRQSYAVWALLLYTLKELNVDTSLGFKEDNGKWSLVAEKPYFSLTHSKNLVAVAISFEEPIGVDVEEISNKMNAVKSRLNVLESDNLSARELTKIWTRREIRIKNTNSKIFNDFFLTDKEEKNYVLTVGCETETDCEIKKIEL